MNTKVLVTGFGPFPNQLANPSQKLVRGLAARFSGAAHAHFIILPTEYGRSLHVLQGAIEKHRPDVVLCFGVAADRNHISLENIGRNFCSTRKPDAGGFVPAQARLDPDGASAYQTNLPLGRLRCDLKAHGLPVKISEDAGGYVCNSVLYHLLAHIHAGGRSWIKSPAALSISPIRPKAIIVSAIRTYRTQGN